MKEVAKFHRISYAQWCKDSKYLSKNTYGGIQLPERQTEGSAGYDFYCPVDLLVKAGETVVIHTGIKCEIDKGHVLELYPRSSLGTKFNFTLDNIVGIIDSDYYNNEKNEGHILAQFTNHSDKALIIKAGDRFMQGIFKEFCITKDDKAVGVRTGGIGSTNA